MTRALAAVLAVALAAACGASGPPPPPAAEERFTAWLAALDSADPARVAAYHAAAFAPDASHSPERDLGLEERTGGLDLVATEPSTAARFIGILEARDADRYLRATLDIEPAAPHRVRSLAVEPIGIPADRLARRTTEAAALAALRARIEPLVAADRFSGAVLVAKRGAPIFAQAYGLADRARGVPNTLDTQFRLGSMNKMFTATAALQLVQRGALSLADPVGKVIPGYPNQAIATRVTLQMLLTHTGGTGDIFGPDFDAHRLALRTLADYVALYGNRSPDLEPGIAWAYSNYGFILAGVMIERASGQSYYDYVYDHVFAPAAMTATASLPEDVPVRARAVGYTRESPAQPWAPNTETLPYRGTSAGGGYSTVGDLLRFANAITANQLLDAAHTAQLVTGQIDSVDGDQYGYGFADSTAEGVRCHGHDGGAQGMNGELEICESGYTIIVLSNLDPPIANRLTDYVRARLPAHAEQP